MKILICNAGSTSLKFKIFEMPAFTELCASKVERVGSERAIFSYKSARGAVSQDELSIPDYAAGIRLFLNHALDAGHGVLVNISEIEGVGYKTVLSKDHYGVHRLTEEVLEGMRAYYSVAPAHNGPYLQAIEALQAVLPNAAHIGVFETAFHRTIPEERRVFPIPYEWTEKYGIRRMGYHGASHSYIAKRLSQYRHVVSCHLGGSASLCAILDGKSMDNSFGFSLQMGIPHASRTGDVDCYIVPFLLEQGLTLEEIYTGLGKNGGLKGISGTSGDVRDIEEAIATGSERAMLAMKVLATHILRYIGAYSMEIGGLDAVAFTGGVGENSVRLRKMVLDGMAHLGVVIDTDSNENGRGERCITTDDSRVAVYVIPADEEYTVANSAYALIADGNVQ